MSAALVGGLPALASAAGPPAQRGGVSELFSPTWWAENFGGVLSGDLFRMGWRLVIGVLLFVAGWMLAKLVSALVFRLLRNTNFDNRLAARLGVDTLMEGRPGQGREQHALERGIARIAFWLMMALVIVGVLDYAQLPQAASPIQGLVDTVMQALPLIGKAILILVVAYFVGTILQRLVSRGLSIARIDARYAELNSDERACDPRFVSTVETDAELAARVRTTPRRLSDAAGQAVFWLVMIIGLVGAFDALRIDAIARPLSNLIDTAINLLPAIGAAALIGIGGYILAKIARVIVTRGLEALGFDRLFARFRLGGMFGVWSPSRVVGSTVSGLILLQTAIAAIDRLGIDTLSAPLTRMMGRFWELLPALAVSVLIVVLGVVAGRLLRSIVQQALVAVGFDRLMDRIGFGQIAQRSDDLARPSGLLAFIVQVGVVLLAVVQALRNVDLDMWAAYVDSFLLFSVTRVAVALLVIIVGFAIGNYVRDLVEARQREMQQPPLPAGMESELRDPVWMAEFARYAVLVFAFTMAVHQLGFAQDFVLVSFGLLFGALCLAGALAFGLGSREVAGEIVRDRYRRSRQQSGIGTSPMTGASVRPPSKSEQ